jgi:hypothetical protein
MDDSCFTPPLAALSDSERQRQWENELRAIEESARQLREFSPDSLLVALLDRRANGMRECLAATSPN